MVAFAALITVLAAVLPITMASASTSTCGTITNDVVWNSSGSPFEVCDAGLTVAAGGRLTIDGTTGPVEVKGGSITVLGTMRTVHTNAVAKVTFDAPSSALSVVGVQGANAVLDLSWSTFASWSVGGSGSGASSVTLDHDTFTGLGSVGIQADDVFGSWTVSVTNTSAPGIGVQCGRTGSGVINNNTVNNAAGYGIYINCGNVTAKNNLVTNSGTASVPATPSAMFVNGTYSLGATGTVAANQGSGNLVDAITLSGTITGNTTWSTPTNGSTLHALGYIASGLLIMEGPGTLTLPANSVVKADAQWIFHNFDLDATAPASVITSLEDNSVGPPTCVASTRCQSIVGSRLVGDQNSTLDFGAVTVRHSSIESSGPITMSGTTATDGRGIWLRDAPSATFTNCTLRRMAGAGIMGTAKSVAITACTVDGVVTGPEPQGSFFHGDGINVDANGANPGTVTVTGTTVRNTEGPGIRVVHAAQFTVSGNTVTGTKHSAISGEEAPAFALEGLTVRLGPGSDIHDNLVANNELDAIELVSVTVPTSFTWVTPTQGSSLHAPGYWGGGPITVASGASVTIPNGAIVHLDSIRLLGGDFDAAAGHATITTNTIEVESPANGPVSTLAVYDAVVTGGGLHAHGAIADIRRTTITDGRNSVDATIEATGATGNTLADVTVTRAPWIAIRLEDATTTISRARIDGNSNIGIAAIDGATTVTCSTIINNAGGVIVGSKTFGQPTPFTLHDSNVHSNDGAPLQQLADLRVTSGATDAQRVFWGQPGGPRAGQVQTDGGSVDASQPLGQPAGCAPADPPRVTNTIGTVTNAGGLVTAAPNVVRNDAGSTPLYVRGADGAVWTNFLGPWTSLGGFTFDGPAAGPIQLTNANFAVFARGLDNAVWMRTALLPFSATWTPWQRLGGQTLSAPALTYDGKTTHLFVRGVDNQLWHRSYAYPSGWTPWEPLGGLTTEAPAATSSRTGTVDVAMRGLDGAVWTRSFDGNTWSPWSSIGGFILGGPSIASRPGHELDVFARGGDGLLYNQVFSQGAWRGWRQLGNAAIAFAPGAILRSGPPTPTLELAFVPPSLQAFLVELR